MKEKIKNFLLNASIVYSIIIVVFMIFTFVIMNEGVLLYDKDENKSRLNEYKEMVSKMKDSECNKAIKDIIKYYEDTSYNGKVNLKNMYDYDGEKGLLTYYINTKEVCNISEKDVEKYDFPTKFLSSIMYREEIYQRYRFQYELKFVDMYMRDIGEVSLYATEYNISRKTILEIIDGLIEISSREENVNE